MFHRSNDLAIDLGTVNTCAFSRSHGLLISEPSIVAYNQNRSAVEAVGHEAQVLLGRGPSGVIAVRPLRDGVIADFEAVDKMLAYVIKKAHRRVSFRRRRMLIGVPSDITAVERRAVRDSAFKANAKRVFLVQEPVAAAIGAGIDVTSPRGSMVVDIGGGTTDVAVISRGYVVFSSSVRVAGNEMDEAIMQYMRRRHALLIGEQTAERVKIEVGSAAPLETPLYLEVRGRHLTEGMPATVTVSDAEIRGALAEPVKAITTAVQQALASLPGELSADIFDSGLVLTGGGALLRNLDTLLRRLTNLPVQTAEDPFSAVVMGASRMLTDEALLRTLATE